MNGKDTDLLRKKLAERLREASDSSLYGTVRLVDESKRTCIVQIGEIDYEDVLLYSIENPDLKGLVFIPAIDSTVMVSRIAGSDRFFVALFSVIDKILFSCEDKMSIAVDKSTVSVVSDKTTFKITQSGFTFKKKSSGLKKTLNDILTALQQLTVPTGVGPSGVPVNTAQFSQIQQDLSNYMEE